MLESSFKFIRFVKLQSRSGCSLCALRNALVSFSAIAISFSCRAAFLCGERIALRVGKLAKSFTAPVSASTSASVRLKNKYIKNGMEINSKGTLKALVRVQSWVNGVGKKFLRSILWFRVDLLLT